MTTNLVLLLSLGYFKRKKREMVFLHAGLPEHLMFWFALCLLCTKQLRQGGVRRTYQKVAFTCPALAFRCGGRRSGPPSPVCLHPCKCGSPLNFPLHPSSAALGSSQLMGRELQLLPPSPSTEQPLSYRLRAAAPRPWARCWQGSAAAQGRRSTGSCEGVPPHQGGRRESTVVGKSQHDLSAPMQSPPKSVSGDVG